MRLIMIVLVAVLGISANANNFTVTNTNDDGSGSLRVAMNSANATPGTHTIAFNIPTGDPNYNAAQGTWTIRPTTNLPYITRAGITFDGRSQTINQGDLNPNGPEIVLDGSQVRDFCFFVFNAGSITIQGFVIRDFLYGIQITGATSTNCVIKGNYIGVNYNATDTAGNYIGIEILGSAGYTTIGGPALEDRNIISGNSHIGLRLLSSSHNTLQNNYIGTDRTGTFALPNYDGLSLEATTQYNLIGGYNASERNLISGNVAYGLPLIGIDTKLNTIVGNYIGTNAAGNAAIPNTYGILFDDGSNNNWVGGYQAGAGNLISGNSGYGVFIYNNYTRDNPVVGNLIGTDYTGTAAVPNANGIVIDGIALHHRIDSNVISGNAQVGVDIHIAGTSEFVLTRNKIGTDITGTLPLGNTLDGVRLAQGVFDNIIGKPDSGNIIAYNGANGITVMTSADIRNTFSANAIYSNGGLGIDLYLSGVTPNDAGDGDTGPNMLMNFPVITLATYDDISGLVSISGTLDALNPASCRVEVFAADDDGSGYGEGKQYLGFCAPDASGNWNLVVPGPFCNNSVTATATDADGNTSEFALNLTLSESWGIAENENILAVYPNPAQHFILLSRSGDENAAYRITDSQGAVVTDGQITQGQINIQSLQPGVYFIQLQYSDRSLFGRFVKQ